MPTHRSVCHQPQLQVSSEQEALESLGLGSLLPPEQSHASTHTDTQIHTDAIATAIHQLLAFQ